MKSTTERGLGWTHQQVRDRLLRQHIDGTRCWWCNHPMYRDANRNYDSAALEADHTRSRHEHGTAGNHADRLLHRRCNRQRQKGARDDDRPAITGRHPSEPLPDRNQTHDPRLMPWPW